MAQNVGAVFRDVRGGGGIRPAQFCFQPRTPMLSRGWKQNWRRNSSRSILFPAARQHWCPFFAAPREPGNCCPFLPAPAAKWHLYPQSSRALHGLFPPLTSRSKHLSPSLTSSLPARNLFRSTLFPTARQHWFLRWYSSFPAHREPLHLFPFAPALFAKSNLSLRPPPSSQCWFPPDVARRWFP